MLRCVAVICTLVTASVLPASAQGASQSRVICTGDFPAYNQYYRVEPRHCTFHVRNKPYAGAWFVETEDLKWKYWRSGQAKAKGRTVVNMSGPSPIRVKLSQPETRCGKRTFTKARFRFPEFDSASTMKLDRCPD